MRNTSVTLLVFMLLCSLVSFGLIGAQVMESNDGGGFGYKGNGMMGAGVLGEEGGGEEGATESEASEAIDEAQSLLAAYLEQHPDASSEALTNVQTLIEEAITAYDEGDYETALSKANEAITLMGGEPVTPETEDDTSVIKGKAEQALADAEAAVSALQEAYVEGAHPAVSTLMDLAISKLESAQAAFENGDYGHAKGQATAAASIAENALRKLEKSSEEGEEEPTGKEGGKPEDTGPPEDAGPPEHAGPPENPGNGKGKDK